jgi:hypothetical protein
MKSLHACEIVRAGGCLSCRQGSSLPSPGQAIRAPASSSANRLWHAPTAFALPDHRTAQRVRWGHATVAVSFAVAAAACLIRARRGAICNRAVVPAGNQRSATSMRPTVVAREEVEDEPQADGSAVPRSAISPFVPIRAHCAHSIARLNCFSS